MSKRAKAIKALGTVTAELEVLDMRVVEPVVALPPPVVLVVVLVVVPVVAVGPVVEPEPCEGGKTVGKGGAVAFFGQNQSTANVVL